MRSAGCLAVSAAVLLLAASCNRAAEGPARPQPTFAESQKELPSAPTNAQERQPAARPGTGGPAGGAALAAETAARKLIRTAQVQIEVADYAAAAQQAEAQAEAHGGYLADSQATREANDRRRGTVTVRVPAEKFKALLAELRQLGKILSENVAAQDVTKAYTDIETRLRVKRETADRLRDILKTKTARLSDVLEAERELARVTEETELLEGERRFYDQQVALSTITLTLAEPEALVRPDIFAPLRDALQASLRALATSLVILLVVVVFLTPWAILVRVGWWLVAWTRRRHKARAVQVP